MTEIKGIGRESVPLELPEVTSSPRKADFQEYLKAYLDNVDQLQHEADRAALEVSSGKLENIHQAMIAMEKAEVSFQLMVETRNRIVKAYEEIMKIQA
jgi:flagellar hook-basal body complex protein FliE